MSNWHTLPRRLWGIVTPRGALANLLGRDKYRELLAAATLQALRSGVGLPSGFTNDDLVAVYCYTYQNLRTLTYKSLNAVLWGEPRWAKKELLELAAHLTVALEKLPAHTGFCWRSTKFDVTAGLGHPVGATVQYPAFTSTSRLARNQPRQGGSYIVVLSKSGRYSGGISRFPKEAEVLFLPGTVFNVLTNQVIGGIRQIDLEEV